jgi:CheY-like chemotaxis protein
MTAYASPRSSCQALIVEDDPLFVTVYRETLTSSIPGIDIDISRNGYLALLHLAQHRPDLIILDLHMPGLDGFEFLDIVKRKHGLQEVPVLVVSSASEARTAPLRALPHVHVFAKPLRPALMKSLIRQLLVQPAPTTQPPPAQRLVLAKLEAFVGADRALQREIARQFYDLAPDRIVQVEDALRRRDYPRLREWCHALTGTSAMIGAEVLQQHIAHLQDHIAYGSSGAIEAAVEAVVDELRQIAIVLDHDYHLSSANA